MLLLGWGTATALNVDLSEWLFEAVDVHSKSIDKALTTRL